MTRLAASLNWLVMLSATAAAILYHAVRPGTWRRPVRAEFWRFMDLTCFQNLGPVAVAAVVVGLALVAQALYWLEQVGQTDAIRDVIVFVMVREIGPLIVGLISLGTGGILLVGELSALRAVGQLTALDSQGVDPFHLLVVPRVVAIVVSVFAHSMLFVMIAFVAGYLLAAAIGANAVGAGEFLALILTSVGAIGYAIIPAKAFAIGMTIGVVCSVTALDPRAEQRAHERLTAIGFMRTLSGILLVSALLSMVL